jgi:aminoglycoside phosphotransferase (APT) family kinase protein
MAVDALDLEVLHPYLEQHVPGFHGLLRAEKFEDGQSNPTFKIAAESGTYVLRRQPPGELLKSAHAVDREFRVQRALARTSIPVAAVYHLCEDPQVIGSMFYVMDFCDGRVFRDAALPELERSERAPIYEEMVRILAAIHAVDLDATQLRDFGRPGNYYERQFIRWEGQYRASELEPIDAMEQLITWISRNLPPDDGRVSLVHGDFRLDNVIFEQNGPQALAVLDWELATLGHPFADLGYLCMLHRMPQGVGRISGLRGTDRDALGLPSETDLVARYCERSGIDHIDNVGFYIAFSFFRLAAIIQGVAKRATNGIASSRDAAELGTFVGPIAELALEATVEGAA